MISLGVLLFSEGKQRNSESGGEGKWRGLPGRMEEREDVVRTYCIDKNKRKIQNIKDNTHTYKTHIYAFEGHITRAGTQGFIYASDVPQPCIIILVSFHIIVSFKVGGSFLQHVLITVIPTLLSSQIYPLLCVPPLSTYPPDMNSHYLGILGRVFFH